MDKEAIDGPHAQKTRIDSIVPMSAMLCKMSIYAVYTHTFETTYMYRYTYTYST